jgi:hypothetical protein
VSLRMCLRSMPARWHRRLTWRRWVEGSVLGVAGWAGRWAAGPTTTMALQIFGALACTESSSVVLLVAFLPCRSLMTTPM